MTNCTPVYNPAPFEFHQFRQNLITCINVTTTIITKTTQEELKLNQMKNKHSYNYLFRLRGPVLYPPLVGLPHGETETLPYFPLLLLLGSAWMRGKWERKESERKENREERKQGGKYNPPCCLDGGGK